MIYSTHKRKHRKTGKHYKNMRGGSPYDDNASSFSDFVPKFGTGTLIGIGIGVVIISIILSLTFTGVIHARSSSSSSGKSL